MGKQSWLVIGIAALIFTFTAGVLPAFCATQTVFGPEDFTTGRLHLLLSRHSFDVSQPGDGLLRIRKITPDKQIIKGFVVLNRKLILPGQLREADAEVFEKEVQLKARNRITVFLLGKPGTSINIEILAKGISAPPKIIAFTADPSSIHVNESSTLSWQTENAESCTIDPGGLNVGPNGYVSVSPTDTTTYTFIAAGTGDAVTAQTTVTVVNTPPKAISQALTTKEDESIDITLSGSDADNDNLTYELDLQPGHGTINGSLPNIVYTPQENHHGTDAFSFFVNDGTENSQAATIHITILSVNDIPIAIAGEDQTVLQGDTVKLDAGGSTDADGDTLSYQWSFKTVPPESRASFSNPAAVDPTFIADLAGDYEIQLVANDGSADSIVDSVMITADPLIQVPNVAGKFQTDAQAAIIGANLTVGTINTVHSATVPADHVISQSPAGSTAVAEGTAVNMVVSLVPVPQDIDYGIQPVDQFGGDGRINDMVNIINGNVIESRTDIRFGSAHQMGLSFRSFYNSRSLKSGDHGFGWTHTYSLTLNPSVEVSGSTYIKIIDESGRAVYFSEQTAGVYTGGFKEKSQVKLESGTYVWHRLDGRKYGFALDGKLAWVDDATGSRLTLAYDSSGQLETVSDYTTGRILTFNYVSGLLDNIVGPTTSAVANGVWVNYDYDDNGNLSSVTYADGSGFDYAYTDVLDVHNLTEKKDADNHVLATWSYDSQDRCSNQFTRDGRGVAVNYVSATQVNVTDAYSTVRTYTIGEIAGQKRLTAMQGATPAPYGSSLVSWTYDANLNLTEVETAGGSTHQYQNHDSRGNPGTVILAYNEPEEREITYTYHPDMNAALTRSEDSVLGAGSKVTIWDYDDDGDTTPNENPTRLLYRVIEQGFTKNTSGTTVSYEYITAFTYNANGQVLSIDGPLTGTADTTSFAYNATTGDLVSITRPLIGATTFSSYDAAGQVGTITDVNSQSESFDYDGRGRITEVTHNADSSSRSVSYTTAGLPNITTDEDGVTIDFDYDTTYGRLDEKNDMDGNYIAYSYDSQGNLIEKSKHKPDATRSSRNRWDYQHPTIPGILYKQIRADDSYAEYDYDDDGNLTSVSDYEFNTTTFDYDGLNRLITVTQPGSAITSYDYDTHGNLISVIDAESNETTFTYDDMGRVVSTTSPDTGTVTFAYDAAGNPVQKTDAKNITVQYVYDLLNRLTNVNFPDTTQNLTYSYDQGTYGKGRRTGMSDPAGSTSFSYDARGRLTGKTATVETEPYTISRTFTSSNRLSSFTYPGGRTLDLTRYTNGKLQKLETTQSSTTVTLLDNMSYNPFGSAAGLSTGAGGTVVNQAGECDCVETINPGSMMEQVYTYDKNRNLTNIAAANTPWYDQSFVYDALNRLTQGDGIYGTIDYTYDKVGNRITRVIDSTTDTYSYQTGTNRLSSITGANPANYTYDDNGNITDIGNRTFTYNQNNRLIEVEENLTTLGEYEYNGLGQRITKTVDSTTTVFHYDFDGNIIGESDDSGTFSVEYLYMGSNRLAMVDVATGDLYYYLNNSLGTPILMTDDSGTVVWEAFYKPFGDAAVNSNSTVANNFRFAGQYYDDETGLHYNWHRYYDPATGRYLTPDPIGLAGGINLYAYASGNPVNLVDPYGLDPFSAYLFSSGISSGFGVGAASYTQSKENKQIADALWATSTLNPASYINALNWLAGSISDDTPNPNIESGGACPNGDDPDDDSPGNYKFPSEKKLAKEFGIKKKEIHKLKDQLKSDFGPELRKINAHNPDIGISRNGNIVFKNRMTGNTINTKVPVRAYRP